MFSKEQFLNTVRSKPKESNKQSLNLHESIIISLNGVPSIEISINSVFAKVPKLKLLF